MSRKQYSKELKLELVKKHLEDGISYWKLGKEYGIEASIIRRLSIPGRPFQVLCKFKKLI